MRIWSNASNKHETDEPDWGGLSSTAPLAVEDRAGDNVPIACRPGQDEGATLYTSSGAGIGTEIRSSFATVDLPRAATKSFRKLISDVLARRAMVLPTAMSDLDGTHDGGKPARFLPVPAGGNAVE
jgi:hypothetical protein